MCTFIAKHYAEDLTVGQIATVAAVCESVRANSAERSRSA